MAGVNELLRELHRLRRHLRELQTEIDRVPKVIQAKKNLLAAKETENKAAHDNLKRMKITAHERDTTLKATDTQCKKYERQLNEASSPKEFEALQHEIATAKNTIAALENEILELLANIDEQTVKLPELDTLLKTAKAEYVTWEKEQAERVTRLTAERDQTKQQLITAEADIPANVRSLYDRLVTAYGADSFAAVQNKACGHCRTQLTGQRIHEVTSNVFSICAACGRALYLPA